MLNNLAVWAILTLNITILIVSVSCFVKIMKNDLIHLQTDVTKIIKKVDDLIERVSNIEGRLDK